MKETILVLMGGPSGEHEVSLRSGVSILREMNRDRFELIPVGLSKDGRWLTGDPLVAHPEDPKKICLAENLREVRLEQGQLEGRSIDAVFSVVHGTWGEDGCMQGFLDIAGVPYVGSGVLGSSVGMDKDLTKRLTLFEGIKTADFMVLRDSDERPSWGQVAARLGKAVFVKPAAQGSSLGISKAKDEASFTKALDLAFLYDRKLVVESAITGREIELAVLGNDQLEVSLPGEILPEEEFYTYEAKYILNTTKLVIPADLSGDLIERLQETARRAFRALELRGFARMDFFVDADQEIWFNEPNTLPGFTSISMYPKLFAASGLSYPQLLERLIDLAKEEFAGKARLKTHP
ncbi:MAG: D-alanine--D-alanine ligase family protein [bacterium]|nr:D-alanine--D-alanine ligase family protein [bacterium]